MTSKSTLQTPTKTPEAVAGFAMVRFGRMIQKNIELGCNAQEIAMLVDAEIYNGLEEEEIRAIAQRIAPLIKAYQIAQALAVAKEETAWREPGVYFCAKMSGQSIAAS